METKRLFETVAALAFFAAHDAISQPLPLEITEQPLSVETNPGSDLYESVTVTGSGGAYRWQYNGRDLPGAAGNIPQGVSTIELHLADVRAANAGYYQLIATNSLGSVTSRVARLTVYTNIPPVWVFGQTNAGDWHSVGGASAMKLDAAGNAYVTGWLGDDIRTVKLDPQGRAIWEVTYSAWPQAYAGALALDAAGNAYLTVSEGPNGNWAGGCLTLKYNSDGKLLWSARYDGPAGGGVKGRTIAVDSSGNAYVTCVLSAGAVTIKYAPDGNQVWVARYPAAASQNAIPLAVDKENDVYVAGAGDAGEYVVIKYGSDGHQIWLASYALGGNGSPSAIALDSEGNVVVSGNVQSVGPSVDPADSSTSTTVKFDLNGNLVWAAIEPSGYVLYTALALDAAGNIYLATSAGGRNSEGLEERGIAAWTYDPAGKLRWKTIHNHDNIGGDTHGTDIVADQDGNAYVSATLDPGLLSSGMLVLKFDSHGTREWIARYGHRGGAVAIALDAARNVYVAGYYGLLTLKFAPPDIPRTRLSTPAVASDGRVEIRASGEPGRFYQLESSQDLIQWNSLSETVNATGDLTFVDPNAQAASRRFYRTRKE